MRFGSKNPLETRASCDLGRFGLGLKTASLSQCRCFTVLTKNNGTISCTQWDIDKISSSPESQWTLNLLSESDISSIPELNSLKKEYLDDIESSTIVLWQNLDRINEGTSNRNRETRFNKVINGIRYHLELVFHRFLSPGPGKSKVDIFLNKSQLKAFDPFNEAKSTELPHEKFLFEKEWISVQPYVLPHHDKVNKTEWEKYAGEQGYLQEQGFYVYRNQRLIIYGTWFRLIPKKELTKLLRVKVDISNSLDHYWKIDVKKSHAFPPEGIREELKRIIGEIELSGTRVYKQRGQRILDRITHPAWQRVIKNNQIFYQINKSHPIIEKYSQNLSGSEKKCFEDLISMFESTFPREAFFNDSASSPEQMNKSEMQSEQIKRLLTLFFK